MAEPNGLARSSRYSGVAGGCSVETKARDKAVVTDGIKEMEELPGSLCISRELWLWEGGGTLARCCTSCRETAARLRTLASLVSLKKTAHAKHNWVAAVFVSGAGEERVWGRKGEREGRGDRRVLRQRNDERGRNDGSPSSSVEKIELGRYDTFDGCIDG